MALIITLIAIGILLLAIELLITPGFGIPGIVGIASIVGAVVLAFINFGKLIGVLVLVLVIIVLGLSTILFLRSKTWRKISLSDSINSNVSPLPDESGIKIGDRGVAISRLAPSGKGRIGANTIEVWSQLGLIDNGATIEVIEIDGSKVIVKEYKE